MSRLGWMSLVLLGCEGVIPGGPPGVVADDVADDFVEAVEPEKPLGPRAVPRLPSVAVCESAPMARGYLGLGGEPLEAGRSDAMALKDTHRPFRNQLDPNNNWWWLVSETSRSLAIEVSQLDVEVRDPGVGAAFGVVSRGWYEESEVGAFAVFVTFQFAHKACLRAFETRTPHLRAGWFEHTAFAPTRERAQAFCRKTQQSAWLRPPREDEVETCVQLALDLESEPDVKRRWAAVCASIFASTNFLAN